MPWTTPATWTVSEEVTSAALNAQVRDNLNWLHDPTRYWARAYLAGSPPTIANSTDTLVPLNTVAAGEDPSAMFNATTHLFTVPAKGLYLVTGGFRITAATFAAIACGLYKNASSGPPQYSGAYLTGDGTVVLRQLLLAAGDTIGLNCWQNTGGAASYDIGGGAGTANSLAVTCLSLQP